MTLLEESAGSGGSVLGLCRWEMLSQDRYYAVIQRYMCRGWGRETSSFYLRSSFSGPGIGTWKGDAFF